MRIVIVPLNQLGDCRQVTLYDGEKLCDGCGGRGGDEVVAKVWWGEGLRYVRLPQNCRQCKGEGKVRV